MPKTNDIHSKAHRSKGSDKKKNTFKKYGKNTTRGIRIKLADMINENKAKKNESNRGLKNKNKNNDKFVEKRQTSVSKNICRNKKHGGK